MIMARIIRRAYPDGREEYTIQQRHFIFRWWWVDAWANSSMGAACRDTYPSMKEARDNLWRFDGTKIKDEVMIRKG